MKNLFLAPVLAAALFSLNPMLGVSAQTKADANVTVRFADPAKFSDASFTEWRNDEKSRGEVLASLEAHLRTLGAKLPAGQSLAIDVTNVDMAGEYEPFRRSAQQIRVLRSVTWPRIELSYVLSEGGREVAKGQETVSDMSYQSHTPRYFADDRLRYEKAMLDDWFNKRFIKAAAAR